MEHKTLMCKLSNSSCMPAPCRNVYIKPLPNYIDECVSPPPPLHSPPPPLASPSLFVFFSSTLSPSPPSLSLFLSSSPCCLVFFRTNLIIYFEYYSSPTLLPLNPVFKYIFLILLLILLFFYTATLRNIFGNFGGIQSVKLVRDPHIPTDVVGLVRYPYLFFIFLNEI